MSLKNLICIIKLYIHKKKISAYIDKNLDEVSEGKILHLISQCPEAKIYLEKLLILDKEIRSIPLSMPSALIKERIDNAIVNIGNKQIADEIAPKQVARRISILASTFAAVLVIIIIVFSFRIIKHNTGNPELMLASMDMYQHMDLYENMDMIEHLKEIMIIKQNDQDAYKRVK